ncbi:MAG TPA: alpha/beta hydrolase [Polyangiales bacterium]
MRDGQRLYVRSVGRGAPCVLVHGFASSGASWLPFIAPLLHRYRFLMPDLRGFGASQRAALRTDCPLDTYGDDLGELAERLELRDAALIGMSMGALSAVRCFERGRGARFSRYMHIDQGLVIHNASDAPHGLLGPAQPGFFARVRRVLDALERHTAEQSERGVAASDYAMLSHSLRRELASVFSEFAAAAFTHPQVRGAVERATATPRLLPWFLPAGGFAAHLQIMRAYLERQYDLRSGFRTISVPSVVLIGGASRMYPAEGQRKIAALSAHASSVEIPGVGHMLPLEAPRAFLRELRAFLA